MCLITKQKEPKILKADKYVVKLMAISPYDGVWVTPYQRFAYIKGEINKTSIEKSYDATLFCEVDQAIFIKLVGCRVADFLLHVDSGQSDYVAYDQGFHSIDKSKAAMYIEYLDHHTPFVFKIPKGSEVYVNKDTGLIVSNQIIFTGKKYVTKQNKD